MSILWPSFTALVVSLAFTTVAVTHPHAAPLLAGVIVAVVVVALLVWSHVCTRRAQRWTR